MNTTHIKIQTALEGGFCQLPKVMDEYRMDCSNGIEMHELGRIYRTRTTGPDTKFPRIKPCFLLRKFCVLLPGSWEEFFV
jgi:hypothetical protein